ncbi:STAS domain-containing protein [Fictibacillus enclensis]|uniref:STAS domain-containing protein n=1 Tax=Fictibacillus enclensis TaxID=1017270 RepID=UPI0024C0A82F|nr:STAS domain-containing protein [Fictibacillus enclensis]WHY73626.1 GAF domain-containing protein [Fictibacillus enclensis]
MNKRSLVTPFSDFEEAADSILSLISKFISINTLFIAKNDTFTNEMVKVHNRDYVLLNEGEQPPFKETYCNLSVENGKNALVIADISENPLTKKLNVTKDLGNGSFIGIPVYYENGDNYGTICGLDSKPFSFTEDHIELFTTMASLMTYVLGLTRAKKEINQLSAPMISITKGVAILPIIGEITESRAEAIIQLTLEKTQTLSLESLVIDLSGITQINEYVTHYLLTITKTLSLLGVLPILTGFRPDMARRSVNSAEELSKITIKGNLEDALTHIGFSLIPNET